MIAKSSKWQATPPRNAFFLFGMKEIISMMVALLILTLLENSGALPRLTLMTNTSVEKVTGVFVDKTATLKKKVQVS